MKANGVYERSLFGPLKNEATSLLSAHLARVIWRVRYEPSLRTSVKVRCGMLIASPPGAEACVNELPIALTAAGLGVAMSLSIAAEAADLVRSVGIGRLRSLQSVSMSSSWRGVAPFGVVKTAPAKQARTASTPSWCW